MMDGGPIDTSAVRFPACLQYLAYERRWVGWQWDKVGDRWTKPPRRIVDGRAAGHARNNRPEDWGTLEDARTAVERHGLAGVGLQLLDLEGFAAIDLDDVREPVSGALLAWASALVETCASYAEVTPAAEPRRRRGLPCNRETPMMAGWNTTTTSVATWRSANASMSGWSPRASGRSPIRQIHTIW